METNKKLIRQVARLKYLQLARGKSINTHPSRFNILVPISNNRKLLFNSFTRSLCLLSETETALYHTAEAQAAKNMSLAFDTAEQRVFFKQLSVDGFCVKPEVDEIAFAREVYDNSSKDESHLGLTIAPTMDCNLACGYCYQGLNKPHTAITDKLEEHIISLIEEKAEKLQTLNITWYGGEPLVRRQKLLALSRKLINLSEKHNIRYSASIVSNGVYLNAKVAQKLIEHGCHGVQITIDGPMDLHDKMRPTTGGKGSYQLIMRNIGDVLANTTMSISVRINIGKENVSACDQLLDEFELKGFNQYKNFGIYFAPIEASTDRSGTALDVTLGQQAFHHLIRPYKKRALRMGMISETAAPGGIFGMCVAARKADMVLAPNGEIHKCWETMHDPQQRIGRLLDKGCTTEPVGENQPVNEVQNQRLWDEWSPYDNPICSLCRIVPMCGGACPHRFIYFNAGGANTLPCPEWKWNATELIFERALEKGYVTEDEWLDGYSTASNKAAGEFQSVATMQAARAAIHAKTQREN